MGIHGKSKLLHCLFLCIMFSTTPFHYASAHSDTGAPGTDVVTLDANLLPVIRTKVGKPTGDITVADLRGMTSQLSAGNRSISSLAGLEHATGIDEIVFYENSITDLSPLANLTQLAYIHMDDNPITQTSFTSDLSKLVNLTRLNFNRTRTTPGTPISDISVLSNLTKLTILNLIGHRISSLSSLRGLTALTELNLNSNQITDIEPLKNLTSLTKLKLSFNQITDITPLRNLTKLTILTLLRNGDLTTISTIKYLTLLRELWLHHTSTTEAELSEVLPELSNLTHLLIEATPISNLSILNLLPSGVFLRALHVDLMGPPPYDGRPYDIAGFVLKDLAPLVDLMNAGKIGNGSRVELEFNFNLDYESLFTHIPALLAGGISNFSRLYSPVTPGLERNAELSPPIGYPGTEYTFVVQGYNLTDDWRPIRWNLPNDFVTPKRNDDFEKMTVTFTVTAPDGTVTTGDPVLTGANGLARVSFTLGTHGEEHTVTAVVPANTRPAAEGPSHPKLEVSFTVTSDRNAPPPPGQRTNRPTQTAGSDRRGPNRTPDNLAFHGQISFSELMFNTTGEPDALPQWIELYNTGTDVVNLWGWTLEIEGRDADGAPRYADVRLNDLQILPNKTALIVASDAPHSENLLKKSMYNFFEHHPNAFRDPQTQRQIPGQHRLLGETGFHLKLSHPTEGVSDVVGNLDGDRFTDDTPAWELSSATIGNPARTSLLRFHDIQGRPLDGSVSDNYVRAADVVLEVESYYGKATDIGNPGYENGWSFPGSPPGSLYISELMLTSKGGLHALPQWIELYNDSETPVDLRDYQLKIEALDASGERRHAVISLDSFHIPPRQTALLVSKTAGRRSRHIRDSVYPIETHHRDVFKPRRHRDRNTVFGQTGFFLKLSDPDGSPLDIVGNLDGIQETADAPRWTLPRGEGEVRTSLMRRYHPLRGILLDGKARENWIPASQMMLEFMTYYGGETDIGNPGYANDESRIPGPGVSFSELMWTNSRGRRSLPAWIEVYNNSERPVDLKDYQLEIEACDAAGEHHYGVITFQRFLIESHQAAVLVPSSGRQSPDFPKDRMYPLYRRIPDAFRWDPNQMLGQSGFYLKLSDPYGSVSDIVGNLDGNRRTKDLPTWQLPSGSNASGDRTSLMRRYREIGMPLDGRASENWRTASEMRLEVMSYYGKATDIGNPGYPNQENGLLGPQVSFSELMLTASGGTHSLPQWIELYNDSETEIDLRDYQLHIEARDTQGKHRHDIITLKHLGIPAKQTALIVTSRARSSREIPRETVFYARNAVLGQSGFYLKLLSPDGHVSDIAGNIDGDRRTQDEPAWQLPDGGGWQRRTSLMRRYYHVTGIPLDGKNKANWVPASNLPLTVMTYYGRETDIGNPGHRGGGPLPVGLSSFRAERNTSGAVVITWRTESETENAGFHIQRAQMPEGAFVKINEKLIAGAGTTSQRQTYTYTDTTASNNIVYYYRLYDVSLRGDRQRLATTRLRGHVSANGKRLGTWGSFKSEH